MNPYNTESVKIKSIYFPLRDYEFDHGPSSTNLSNKNFIGRELIIDRLCLLLDVKNKRSKTGVYLVAGYRGMGKTSIVREAITKINTPSETERKDTISKQKELKSFEFSLSQDEVHEFELLRQIAWKINRYLKDELKINQKLEKKNYYRNLCSTVFLIFSIIIALGIVNSTSLCPIFDNPFESKGNIGFVFLFFGLISLIYGFIKLIVRTIFNNDSKEETKIIRQLNQLNNELQNRIYSSLSQEDPIAATLNLGNTNPATSIANKILDTFREGQDNKRNTVSYKKATPKEIEQYLHQILKSINDLRTEWKGDDKIPPFVFIIDELDKIEPDYYFTPGDNESEKFLYQNTNSFHVDTKARKRNEAITRLLANLKNFLNNSDAKFIFIGGRGMYDASLADIADRESFYSSIFNEVIYVPNFFKDKLSPYSGLTQLTESFLCSLIMEQDDEKDKKKWKYNLLNLAQEYERKYSHILNKEKKIFKILHTLQNLIIYLTFRSNGSPKKLIELIEGFISKEENDKPKDGGLFIKNTICSKEYPESNKLYLRIGYQNQYEINLHSDLYRPYISINSKHLKSLGDKLLYSTAYLIDHILKFHKTAFSWRNLEHMPDIILANKDPNFRQFYSDVMNNFSHQHLRTTVNGVFQYKFNTKVANELKFVSKISEQSSAAFNFTLDESYHLKSYYKKKLAAKYKEYHELSLNKGNFKYIYTIGYLHSVIAEIHYYDAEYDDAILHYSDALQLLESDNMESTTSSHNYVLYVRNALNMGLCFEKLKMYDRAYSIYRSMILELKKLQDRNYDQNSNTEQSYKPIWEKSYKRMLLFQRPHIALLNVIEKDRQDGITYDNLKRNLSEYLNFLDISHLELFPDGSKYIDYEKLERPLILVDKKRIITLISDYYFSVASILFYKNSIFSKLSFDNEMECEISKKISTNLNEKHGVHYHPSHAAYLYYLHALMNFNSPYKENINQLSKKSTSELIYHLKFVTNYLDPKIYKILNSDQFNILGNIIAKLGDSLLACLSKKEKNISKCKKYILLYNAEHLDRSRENSILDLTDSLSLELIFVLYRISYHCYNLAGKKHSAIFQYKKMLYVLKDTIKKGSSKNPIFDKNEIDKIFQIPIKAQIDISRASNRSQLMKYRIYTKGKDEFTPHLYNNLSTSPEVKEYILLRETILIKLELIEKSDFYIGEYSTISSMFTRILELKFKGDQELAILKKKKYLDLYNDLEKQKFCDLRENSSNIMKVVNALFSFSQVLKILKTYGVGYILNHSFIAAIYERIAITCVYYHIYQHFAETYPHEFPKLETPKEKLKNTIGNNFIFSVDPYEYYDLAKLHYQSAIELHSEGSTYKEISKEMYVLDDDFNDNLTHFCAAIERYRINTGCIEEKLEKLEKILNGSELLIINNYVE